jgi:hypothetical protein
MSDKEQCFCEHAVMVVVGIRTAQEKAPADLLEQTRVGSRASRFR